MPITEIRTEFTTPKCLICGHSSTVFLVAADVRRWREGALIQDVWPSKTADERELLQTGIHPACWATMTDDEEPLLTD